MQRFLGEEIVRKFSIKGQVPPKGLKPPTLQAVRIRAFLTRPEFQVGDFTCSAAPVFAEKPLLPKLMSGFARRGSWLT